MCVRELSYKLEVSADFYVGLILKYTEATEASEASISHIVYYTMHRQYDQDTDLSVVCCATMDIQVPI